MTEGKEHLYKGCNGDGKASSGCSTFQGLPKVNTKKETMKYLTFNGQLWNGKLEKGTKQMFPSKKPNFFASPVHDFCHQDKL